MTGRVSVTDMFIVRRPRGLMRAISCGLRHYSGVRGHSETRLSDVPLEKMLMPATASWLQLLPFKPSTKAVQSVRNDEHVNICIKVYIQASNALYNCYYM